MSLSLADFCAQDSDSEDEEYIPDERASSEGSESGGELEPSPPLASEGGPLSRKKRKGSKILTRKRRGGRSEGEGEKGNESEQKADGEEEVEKEMKEKVRIDNLWETFKLETASFKPESKGKVSAGPVPPSLPPPPPKKIKIQKTYDFAGEEITVQEEVDADSKEAKKSLKFEKEQASSNSEVPLRADIESPRDPKSNVQAHPLGKSNNVVSKAKSSGLGSVLKSLGKKPKMNTLEKTSLDWKDYKRDHSLEEELARNSKDGFLEKQDFLRRSDLRQFELEREERLKRVKRMH